MIRHLLAKLRPPAPPAEIDADLGVMVSMAMIPREVDRDPPDAIQIAIGQTRVVVDLTIEGPTPMLVLAFYSGSRRDVYAADIRTAIDRIETERSGVYRC